MELVLPSVWCLKIGSHSFLLVGGGKFREFFLPLGWYLKIRELVPPSSWSWIIGKLVIAMNVFLIYIRKHSVVFSHLGFRVNYCVLCMWLFHVMILLMVIFSWYIEWNHKWYTFDKVEIYILWLKVVKEIILIHPSPPLSIPTIGFKSGPPRKNFNHWQVDFGLHIWWNDSIHGVHSKWITNI
jgi:hypothetical protein